MISVRLYHNKCSPCRIEIEGHSGYAVSGEDIVCAAVTSAVRLLETTLNDVLQLSIPVEFDEDRAYLTISISQKLSGNSEAICEALFLLFASLITQYEEEYPGYIKMEVKTNA